MTSEVGLVALDSAGSAMVIVVPSPGVDSTKMSPSLCEINPVDHREAEPGFFPGRFR